MTKGRVAKTLGGVALGATLLGAPAISSAQEQVKIPESSTITTKNDSVYFSSPKDLGSSFEKYKIATKQGSFLYGIRASQCYDPKTQAVHNKDDAKYWNQQWKIDQAELKSQRAEINNLEKELEKKIVPMPPIVRSSANINIDNSQTYVLQIEIKETPEEKASRFKASLEGNVATDGIASATLAGQANLGKGVWTGVYGTLPFGENNSQTIENVSNVKVLDQEFGTSKITAGTVTENSLIKPSYEIGIRNSLVSNNGRTAINLDIGMEKSTLENGLKAHDGEVQSLRFGDVTRTQEYCYETGEMKTESSWSPKVGASVQFKPFNNSNFFLTGGAHHTFNGPNKGTRGHLGMGFTINRKGTRKK